jgi:hypothetical protein
MYIHYDFVIILKKYYGDYNARVHLFPFRTEKLSLVVPMVLE